MVNIQVKTEMINSGGIVKKGTVRMEKKYKYLVSIIIPVYNAENYLRRCLSSLLDQTYPFEKIQVILIDNNSSDNSKELCLGYVYEYKNVSFYSEKKQGVSFARNRGMECAEGKYIMFLDADDYLGKQTIKNVIGFFEQNENKVNLVTYHETKLENGKCLKEHIRYKTLVKTGLYSLEKAIYALQVRLNICIKNDLKIKFDSSLSFQEDQKFCAEMLKNQKYIGYVKEAEYYYEVHNSGLVEQNSGPIQYFESTTRWFEEIFSSFEDVPRYYQALFLHDCIWKFKSNRFWPYHYTQEEFTIAQKRIVKLLSHVDDDVIMKYPDIDIYEKLYWMRLKENSITPYIKPEAISLIREKNIFYTRKNVEIILKRIWINKGFKIRGFLKSTVFNFGVVPELYILVNGIEKKILLTDCAAGYYKAKEKTNTFYGFEIQEAIENSLKIEFKLKLDGIEERVQFYNMPTVPFHSKCKSYITQNYVIEEGEKDILVSKKEELDLTAYQKKDLEQTNNLKLKNIKLHAFSEKDNEVWLYYDSPSVILDNGFIQFLHDMNIQDGVQRYYILSNPRLIDMYKDNLDYNQIVLHGSDKHTELFFNADKIITSFSDEEVIWPLNDSKEKKQVRGLFNAEIVYLQHGVLHAHLPWYYSKYTTLIDKIVISTAFEKDNFIKNYDYQESDLITTGMPRYDLMKLNENVVSNRILFAPSWRSYLVGKVEGTSTKRIAEEERFVNSLYCKGITDFIFDEQLEMFLNENNLFLEIKLHPEFYQIYKDAFKENKSDRIIFARENINLNDYALLITDFSSILYDFVYMKKPIVYFIPDKDEFLSGMNHYRELDIPIEHGFGYFTYEEKNVVNYLKNRNDKIFDIDEKYKSKYENFFFELTNVREGIYKALFPK